MTADRARIVSPVHLPDGSLAPDGAKIIFTLTGWDKNATSIIIGGPSEAVVDGGAIDTYVHRVGAGDRQSAILVASCYFNSTSRRWITENLGQIAPDGPGPFDLADLLAVPVTTPTPPDVLAQALAAAAAAAADADRAEQMVVDADQVTADRIAAETARDAAFANANVYADIATGRAAVADGAQFMVAGASEIIRYRRDSSTTQTELARYPTAAAVHALQDKTDSSAPWYSGAKQVVSGVEDGGARIVSALYIDGSQDDYFAVATSDVDDQWYAGYEQVWYGVAAPDGGIASADLLGGGSFETFMATADPMGIADTIVIIGDSLTQNTTYETALATETGRRIINLGRGSQQSKHIAARMGAISVTMTVSGNQIISGANTITHINGQALAGGLGNATVGNQFLSRGDSNTTDSVTGWLGSVRGTLVRTASGGPPSTTEAYTFTPDAGSILPAKCPAGTPWLTDYSAYRDFAHVIWAGSNDIGYGDDLARVQAMLPAMIDSLGHGRWIVLNPINRTGDAAHIEGATYWLTTFAIEQYLAGLARKNFVNIRRMMIDQGLARAGITASGTDTTDIAADTIATSLKADAIHHNTAGNEVIAEIVAEQINARGY